MTVTSKRANSSFSSIFGARWRRWRNSLRTMFARGDFSTLIITCLIMLIPVLAFNASLNIVDPGVNGWQIQLGQLIPISLLSVIFGFLLSRSHYSELMALLLSAVYAVGTIVAVQFFSAPGDVVTRIREIFTRFVGSVSSGLDRTGGLDPYLLILFLSILVWFLGHNTAWHTFRIDRVWRAILPPGIVLILNSFYNAQTVAIDGYLIIYLFLSLLLIVRSHIEAREFDWYANRVAFTANLRDWFFRAGALLGIVLLVIAWLLPTGNADDNAQRFQNFINNRNMDQLVELLNKLFSSLDNQGVATADYYGGDTLKLGGAIQLGDQLVMGVSAPPIARYYWKSRVFDTYVNGEWTSPRTQTEPRPSGWGVTYADNAPTVHEEITQHFSILASTKLLYAAPQITTAFMPVTVDFDRVGGGAYDPSVIRPQEALRKGDTYNVVSSVVTADAPTLRNTASLAYPAWVKQRNLQVPPVLSLRIRDLAQQIVNEAGAVTPYDKAKAIERWLRANIEYRETPAQPPPGTELIEWTLFNSRQGYCTYYASAMVMMLRMIDIPARMAAGFAEGTFTSNQQLYLVQERDAHTWVEVYFPSIGWVEFEPTSAQQSLDRADPQVTTPTLTPTPTEPPTLTPTVAPTEGAGLPTATPTVPPELEVTFTATPSPTPLVPPSPTPTLTPTPLSPLSFLEVPPAAQNIFNVLFIVGGLLALLSFVGVGALWWVEYRGLDKLSPIGRAYARLRIYANWLKVPLHGAQTPLEQGRRIARDVPPSTQPVMKITDNYIVERYSPPRGLRAEDERQALQAWRKARRTFVFSKLRNLIPRWLRREKKQ